MVYLKITIRRKKLIEQESLINLNLL